MTPGEHRLSKEIAKEPATKRSYGFGGDRIAVKTAIVGLPTRDAESTTALGGLGMIYYFLDRGL
jgi:hypothetical protein